MPLVRVHSVPPVALLVPAAPGAVAVTIDVLRWSTTTIAAISNGALAVEAFAEPDEAVLRARSIGALLAGERDAHRIPGFDLGNSPREMTRERVAGRVICSTTTNGTRALLAGRDVPHHFVVALVNLSASAAALRALAPSHVDIVCAGSEGAPSPEDTACAEALSGLIRGEDLLADLGARVRNSPHARMLGRLGYEGDVEVAVGVDSLPLLVTVSGRRAMGTGAGMERR